MQDEFDVFRVYSTGKFVVPVTNGTSLAILNALESEDKTLSDISCELDLSTSTVFFNLKGLVKNGLIKSYSSDVNKSKTLYSLISMAIVESIPCDFSLDRAIMEISDRMIQNEDFFYRGYHTFAALFDSRVGVKLSLFWNLMGRDIAKSRFNHIKSDRIEELFDQIIKFSKEAGMPGISVSSFVPLVLSFRMQSVMPISFISRFASCQGFIEQIMEDNLHVTYRKPSTEITGSEHKDLKIVFGHSSPLLESQQVSEDSYEIPDPEDFVVVYTGTKSSIIMNDVQIGIIKALSEDSCTLAALSDKLGTAQSTVFVNLSKMQERGLIKMHKDPGTNSNIYSENVFILLFSKPRVHVKEDTFDLIRDAIFKDPGSYFENSLLYLQYKMESVGIDISNMTSRLGQSLAQNFMKTYDGKNAEEFLDIICNTKMPFGATVNVTSFLPLTLSVKFDFANSRVKHHAIKGIYTEFFDFLFSALLKIDCSVQEFETSPNKTEIVYSVRQLAPPHHTRR